jgi:hypothetical protein
MSDNQAIRNKTAKISVNDYEYLANFKLGNFENLKEVDRLVEGINFCMKQTYSENNLNEKRFLNCFKLRKAMLEKADRLNLFD